jgi:hypothetical protein
MSFFKPNLETKGRLLRGVSALLMLVGAALAFRPLPWLGVALLLSGLFVGYEALRGWCLLRACGIKTKL